MNFLLGGGGGPSIKVRIRWTSASMVVFASVSLADRDTFDVGRCRATTRRSLMASSRSLLVIRRPRVELFMAE